MNGQTEQMKSAKPLTGWKQGQRAFKKSFSRKVEELQRNLKFDFTLGLFYGTFSLSDSFYDMCYDKKWFLGVS